MLGQLYQFYQSFKILIHSVTLCNFQIIDGDQNWIEQLRYVVRMTSELQWSFFFTANLKKQT